MGEKVPSIGGAKGIFEIFVPGVFLLGNLLAAIYFSPWTGKDEQDALKALFGNPWTGIVCVVCLGYLIGVLLRLAKADVPDDWCAWYLQRFKGSMTGGAFRPFANDKFPYIDWIGVLCEQYMPPAVTEYWRAEWQPRQSGTRGDPSHKRNKEFFILCKVAVARTRNPIAAEVYATEAMTRYAACMFYALGVSFLLAVVTAVLQMPVQPRTSVVWLGMASAYAFAFWFITKNYRFVRVKEAETVFTACYVADIRFEAGSRVQRAAASHN